MKEVSTLCGWASLATTPEPDQWRSRLLQKTAAQPRGTAKEWVAALLARRAIVLALGSKGSGWFALTLFGVETTGPEAKLLIEAGATIQGWALLRPDTLFASRKKQSTAVCSNLSSPSRGGEAGKTGDVDSPCVLVYKVCISVLGRRVWNSRLG